MSKRGLSTIWGPRVASSGTRPVITTSSAHRHSHTFLLTLDYSVKGSYFIFCFRPCVWGNRPGWLRVHIEAQENGQARVHPFSPLAHTRSPVSTLASLIREMVAAARLASAAR